MSRGAAQDSLPAAAQTKKRQGSRGRAPRRTRGARAGTTAGRQSVGGYRNGEGARWLVVVCRTDAERWEVCEVAEHGERRVIEELFGEGESQASALALARDFLHQQRRRFAV